jgi:hypothetical protein
MEKANRRTITSSMIDFLLTIWVLMIVALQYILYGPSEILSMFNNLWPNFVNLFNLISTLLWPFLTAPLHG